MTDRPSMPPLAKAIIAIAVLVNLVVVTGLSRSGFAMILMLFSNLAVCGVIYAMILRHFDNRLP